MKIDDTAAAAAALPRTNVDFFTLIKNSTKCFF